MPREVRLWRVSDEGFKEVEKGRIELEKKLHDWLENDISLISDDLLVIGREVPTDFNKFIDLLCLDGDGNVAIIELKRDRAPREVLAQVLEYASWIDELPPERIIQIANDYLLSKRGIKLEDAFQQKFEKSLPEYLNDSHKMLIVASELDDQTERVLSYLSKYGIDINAVTFSYFQDGDNCYMARVVLIPESVKETAKKLGKRVPGTVWTLELLKENLEEVEDKILKERLSLILNFAVKNAIFIESRARNPSFSLGVKSTRERVLSIGFDGSMYAFFGLNELRKYPTKEARDNFVQDLKRLNLLQQDLNPDDIKSGKILERKLSELTDNEFEELLRSIEHNLLL